MIVVGDRLASINQPALPQIGQLTSLPGPPHGTLRVTSVKQKSGFRKLDNALRAWRTRQDSNL